MSATRDGNGDRDERSRVIEFWHAAEIFSPQPLPRPDATMRITDAGPRGTDAAGTRLTALRAVTPG